MGQGSARIYNILSIVFILLSACWLVFVLTRFVAPPPTVATPTVAVPTVAFLPTETPTFTPTITLPPTETFTPTATFTASNTPEPSITASVTPTDTGTLAPPTATPVITNTPAGPAFNPGQLPPSFTPVTPGAAAATATPELVFTAAPGQPTNTLFPSITPSLPPAATDTATGVPPTLTPLLQGDTPSPFPFALREPYTLTLNFANATGCLWQGIGGQVFDINNAPLTGVRVHVFGPGVDTFVVSGSNTLYGPSGFEVAVGTGVSLSAYIVELQSPTGTVISDQVQVNFPARCEQNLALVNFRQTRPF
ncbi:MAG: hypothetical protein SF162_03585 [bacterium]|nr:hypothetical protein [bacterium]